uniref:Unknown protein 1 (Fragments) n=1 Tax=Pseudotsuga menziesii TaxID=3357 RepID=UP01_PSEMZ|nr:RecName: Full=Unknown protein 1 [Pseudotsuga menziesii]
ARARLGVRRFRRKR